MSIGKSSIVFTDGACSGNPGPGGWGAVIISPNRVVRELGGRSSHTTNNQMELTAVIEALRLLADDSYDIEVLTDSTYVIKGITEWIDRWKTRGWKSSSGDPVSNIFLWEELDHLVTEITAKKKINWVFVKGHSGIEGNEKADRLAVAYSRGDNVDLYEGPLADYSPSILADLGGPSVVQPNSKARYLSLVNGHLRKHETWAECEHCVKGISGAKFKKVSNDQEEEEILKKWGLK